MCGRYVVARTLSGQLPELLLQLPGWPGDYENFNIAPTSDVPIVLESADTTTGEIVRHAELAHWGFVAAWKKSFSERPQPINARIESVATNGMFRSALRYRRCIVPASGYYEWQVGPDGLKQPYFIHAPHGLAFAGIYEDWGPDAATRRRSTTILTRGAVGPAARLHDRLPVMLTPDAYAPWLGDDLSSADEAVALLMSASTRVASTLEFYPVDRRVGNVRNNDSSLCERVDAPPSVG
jgi:putative SOS response-associated peptidase YedK